MQIAIQYFRTPKERQEVMQVIDGLSRKVKMADSRCISKTILSELNKPYIHNPIIAHFWTIFANNKFIPKFKEILKNKIWLTCISPNVPFYTSDSPIIVDDPKNIFTISKSWLMTFDITGSTRGHNMTNEMCSQWGVDLSVRRFFLQKHLQIALAANDIFHTRNQSWWMNVKDVRLYKDSDADTRRVTLTISYTFNPKKSRYKGKNADEKEMKRL